MTSKQALQPTTETKAPVLVEVEKVFAQIKEATTSIAQRAYEFFEARGREFGHELEDWLRAETELIRHIPVEIKDTANTIIVRAEVPGFKTEDLKISVDARRLTLSGKVETATEEKKEEVVYNDRRSQQFYRTVTLPAEVDATKATNLLRDGVLELTLPKTTRPAAIPVPVNTPL